MVVEWSPCLYTQSAGSDDCQASLVIVVDVDIAFEASGSARIIDPTQRLVEVKRCSLLRK